MPAYHFAIHHDADGRENLGYMDLANDDEAFDFGRETVRLILLGGPLKSTSSVMEITEGDRTVGPIALDADDLIRN